MEIDIDKLDRLEIINHVGESKYIKFGRCFSAHKICDDFGSLQFSLQDNKRTLKIFLDK